MSTNSILHNVNITDEEQVEQLVKALEESKEHFVNVGKTQNKNYPPYLDLPKHNEIKAESKQKKYIEVDIVADMIRNKCLSDDWKSKLINTLHRMNFAEAVGGVRCKNCKYLTFSNCYGECSKVILGIVRPDDYCSRGERRI